MLKRVMEKSNCKYCGSPIPSAARDGRIGHKDKLCIFHEPHEHKDAGLFMTMARAKIEAGDFDFSGFIFPAGTANFDHLQFERGADFSGAVFLGEASFRSARFGGSAIDFSGAVFHAGAHFAAAIFGSEAVFFSRAVFSGPADFADASFQGETANFTSTRFADAADFHTAVFSGFGTYFTEATFAGARADFSHCMFGARTSAFKWARFTCDTDFSHAAFTGDELNFQGTTFSRGRAAFVKARFGNRKALFANCRFSGRGCSFSGAVFEGETVAFQGADFAGETAVFSNALFASAQATFRGALFSAEKVDYSGADFECSPLDFRDVVISGRMVTFTGARFRGQSRFDGARFFTEHPAVFTAAEFYQSTSFANTQFQRGAEFASSRFAAETDFSRAIFPNGSTDRSISFRKTEFAGAVLFFDHVDMRRALFAGFRLASRFRGNKVRWPSKRHFFHLRKRFTCADEMQARTPEALRQAAEVLNALEKNMRRNGVDRIAVDFAFSALECRRKARRWFSPSRHIALLLGAWPSGYSQRMWNLAFAAVLIIIAFAILFFLIEERFFWLDNIGIGGNGPADASRLASCLGKSIAAFFAAGFFHLPSATRTGRILSMVEGVLGLLILSASLVFSILRTRIFSGPS
jgi:hypothetical protein